MLRVISHIANLSRRCITWRPMANCHPAWSIVGFARRDKSDDEFRRDLEESTRKFSRQPVRDEIWNAFAQSFFIIRASLVMKLVMSGWPNVSRSSTRAHGTRGNRLFYLAAGPDQFESILKNLKAAGLNQTCEGSWARVIIEKPFGTDLASARELNRVVRNSFTEEQTYRIDHFLGKETAQNILVLRFANAIFSTAVEHALHRSCADHSGGNTRGRNACRLLRNGRRIARHGAESSDSAPMSCGDGTAY